MTRDAVVFYSEFDDPRAWKKALAGRTARSRFPVPIRRSGSGQACATRWPGSRRRGFFARFPNLKLVVNLGAGVDSLVGRDDLPDVPISRLSDDGMVSADDQLRAVRRHPLCARHPASSSARSGSASGTTSIRARCPTSKSACSASANSGRRPRRRWQVGLDVTGWAAAEIDRRRAMHRRPGSA